MKSPLPHGKGFFLMIFYIDMAVENENNTQLDL